jgi:thiol-disulfide isomerase/thioredoxin
MDRLSAVACLLLLAACDSSGPASEQPGRVDAVLARVNKKTWSDVCDVTPAEPSAIRWPQLTQPVAAQRGSKFRWVNIWASWCKPCVEELPLLTDTLAGWRAHGQNVALTLVSVDADPASAADFFASRPQLPPSVRLQDSTAAPGWLAELGLGAGVSIPVHLVLDAQDKLLCARAGSIGNRDLEQFQKVLFP